MCLICGPYVFFFCQLIYCKYTAQSSCFCIYFLNRNFVSLIRLWRLLLVSEVVTLSRNTDIHSEFFPLQSSTKLSSFWWTPATRSGLLSYSSSSTCLVTVCFVLTEFHFHVQIFYHALLLVPISCLSLLFLSTRIAADCVWVCPQALVVNVWDHDAVKVRSTYDCCF